MAEYIERGAAVAAMQNAEHDLMADYGRECGCEWGISTEKAIETIKSVPAADVVPAVHGRWDDSLDGITPFCTVCGCTHRCLIRKPIYCPNCGAKMDLEE